MTLSISQRRLGVLLMTALLLAVPLVAMQFTRDVRWTAGDFLVAGGLLLSAGFLGEWILRSPLGKYQRILLLLAALVVFGLLWAELAVGIFGTPFAGS